MSFTGLLKAEVRIGITEPEPSCLPGKYRREKTDISWEKG
jgi:hypothetical protein